MDNTFSTDKFIEITLKMHPVPPGTKATPRPPDRPREVFLDDPTQTPAPPADVPPEKTAGADE